MSTKNAKIWISYDLGINGNYNDLFAWLDGLHAEECGDSLAIIKEYSYTGELEDYVKQDIGAHVSLEKNDRIYLICTNPVTAKFIFGGRKRAVWAGYAVSNSNDNDI